MIAKFVAAIISVISGVTQGFATTFVDGTDTLLLTDIVTWIARRVGRIGR